LLTPPIERLRIVLTAGKVNVRPIPVDAGVQRKETAAGLEPTLYETVPHVPLGGVTVQLVIASVNVTVIVVGANAWTTVGEIDTHVEFGMTVTS